MVLRPVSVRVYASSRRVGDVFARPPAPVIVCGTSKDAEPKAPARLRTHTLHRSPLVPGHPPTEDGRSSAGEAAPLSVRSCCWAVCSLGVGRSALLVGRSG